MACLETANDCVPEEPRAFAKSDSFANNPGMGKYSIFKENPRITGQVTGLDAPDESSVRLQIESGPSGQYRISQVDDYSRIPRSKLLYYPPISLTLQARVSAGGLPGTWGFGFWNDPFALGIGIKGSGLRLPALPETAWFFFGSPRNDLSVSSVTPANGLMASVFSSTRVPSALLPLGLPVLSFLGIKPAARMIRRLAARFIHDEFVRLDVYVTKWHTYRVDWLEDSVIFRVDGDIVLESKRSPRAPLGLVIWIDNQYAAFSADGAIHFGTEQNQTPAWLEINNPVISTPE
jgi:hypothetical protein